MTLPSHIQGLVFDLDGTLADTMPLHFKAWTAAMDHYGREFTETMFYDFAGVPTKKIFEILNEERDYGIPVEEATELKERLFEQYVHLATPIDEVVRYIHDHPALPMAIATGGTRDIASKILATLGLGHHFKAVVTADDVLNGKPAPDIFLKAAELIGVAPPNCAAFEDGEPGLKAARAAGMFTIDIRPLRRP